MNFIFGLAATTTILFQTQYAAMSTTWALIHGAGLSSFLSFLPTALALGFLWAGWFLIKHKTGNNRTALTLAFSIAVVAGVEAIAPITPLKAHLQQEAITGVKVRSVSDEPLLSENGHLLGIRLVFDATFPRAGAYSISPSQYSLLSGESEFYPLQFGRILRISIHPKPVISANQPGKRTFLADTTYRFSFDIVPNFLFYEKERNNYCVYIQPSTNLLKDDVFSAIAQAENARRRTWIQVDGPTSFTERVVVSEYTTRRAYSVKEIYDGVISEGSVPCEF